MAGSRSLSPKNGYSLDPGGPDFAAICGTADLSAFAAFVERSPRSLFKAMAVDSVKRWENYRDTLSQEVSVALNQASDYEMTRDVDARFHQKLAKFAPALQEQVDQQLLNTYIQLTGGTSLQTFRNNHPNNKAWDETEISTFQNTLGSGDLNRYRNFITHYPSSPFNKIVRDSIWEIELAGKPRESISFASLQGRLATDLDKKDWDAAVRQMRLTIPSSPEDEKWYDNLLSLLRAPESDITSIPLTGKINDKGSAYVPVVTTDGKTLYFCGYGFANGKGKEDIFYAKMEKATWSAPKLISELSTSSKHESPLSVSADGNTLLVFLSGKVGYSKKTADGWSTAQLYDTTINRGTWQSDAIISADGKAMLYVIGRGWGTNNDIHVSLRKPDGSWGSPKKLGEAINSEGDERTPFLHPDMKTLYFSSAGRGGFGGLDVFVSSRLDDSWDNWSEPRNLGKEINTTDDDWGYKISTDGKKAYFAADVSSSKSQLFEVNLPEEFRPEQVVTIEGKVDGLSEKESATILVLDSKTKKEITRVTTDPGTGEYFIVLPSGIEPEVKVEKQGVFSQKMKIKTVGKDNEEKDKVVQNLEVLDFNTEKVEDLSLTFEDVLFETDQSIIRPDMHPTLDELAKILVSQGLKTQIHGYTDDVGSASYNQELSRKRASAVKEYLIAKGCQDNLISTEGYGEANPIGDNQTEEGRAANRRVEISFERVKNE